jgi:hypothetical protein
LWLVAALGVFSIVFQQPGFRKQLCPVKISFSFQSLAGLAHSAFSAKIGF